jgi:hypothetical protein
LQLPDDSNDDDNDDENKTGVNSNATHKTEEDEVDGFVERTQKIRLREASPPGLRVSQHKWLEIANAALTSDDVFGVGKLRRGRPGSGKCGRTACASGRTDDRR